MTESLRSLLAEGTARLKQRGIHSAALDARLLLQHVTEMDHASLIAADDDGVRDERVQNYLTLITRRQGYEPVSRILGVREFFGREFLVTPAVLDPRPDTETVIDLALVWGKDFRHPPRLLDLGCGSGIIALTLLCEWPTAQATATDVSEDALHIAQRNAAHLNVADRVTFLHSDWWQKLAGRFDIILSNPPYIALGEQLPPDVAMYDPPTALYAGAGGLAAYQVLAAGAGAHLTQGGCIMVEIGSTQGPDVTDIFTKAGFALHAHRHDLNGHLRVLSFKKP